MNGRMSERTTRAFRGDTDARDTWLNSGGQAGVTDPCGNQLATSELILLSPACGGTRSEMFQFAFTDGCNETPVDQTATLTTVDTTCPIFNSCPPGHHD